ncbi:T9SS type A sorting domain-containing protein [Chryseobacterium oryctis]|uniref:T9SS type A sorting domain-containing protein n=1 Tax=Chryseobacterium oryctis TaxID=2952618 RepID=A0ABT3HKP3_9FLAO|nr:T9SS type A sorting domain-containing protein [Chryseobacterium oryctis]MCW3160349.1 T9SS type A sorting domain-containing protein [Chryseobacterium oryctis]
MKALYLLGLTLGSLAFGQTITFKGCYNLFDNQEFVFTKTGVDAYNKNIYITTPVDGQPCGGLGTCEFKIQWNNTLNRWEFLADEGNGTFTTPYLIYYNSTGNNAANNPPSNTFGTWVENTTITQGDCGGNLNGTNSTMTGDVHSTSLATLEATKTKIQIFPNPVTEIISISGIENAKSIQVYNTTGQLIQDRIFDKKLNVSTLTAGVYLLRVITKDSQIHEFKFVKK